VSRAVKNKNRFYSKGSEQCIKRGFFPPGYAELEPSASYLASSSSGAALFFVPEQTGLLIKLLKFSHLVSCHLALRKNAGLSFRRSRVRAPSQTVILKVFLLHQNAGHYHQRPLKLS
jgi:hypothetical protein